jgi:hypothetical protein
VKEKLIQNFYCGWGEKMLRHLEMALNVHAVHAGARADVKRRGDFEFSVSPHFIERPATTKVQSS